MRLIGCFLFLALCAGCGDSNGTHRPYVISKSHAKEILEIEGPDETQLSPPS